MNNSRKTANTSSHPKQRFDKPCWNPFGPVVGNMQHIITCNYRNRRGEVYVASKALCFRRTALFGWEIFRLVVPWESVKAIDVGDFRAIFIQTSNDEQHEICGFHDDDDVSVVRNLLSDAWNRRDVETEQDAENNRVVNHFFKRLSLLSDSEDVYEGNAAAEKGTLEVVKGDYQDTLTKDQLKNLWSIICSEKDSRLTEKVTVNLALNITIDTFFDMFLSDDAVVSIASHHEATGDENVRCTQWEQSNKFTMKRLVTYNHPIDIPLAIAPPAGSATKTQIMHRFEEGLCVDTETWISDVPLADCFYVADRLLVSTNPDGGILLTITFGNCFVKPTLFRRIIASTSTRDVSAFHKAYVDKIKDHVRKNRMELPIHDILKPSSSSGVVAVAAAAAAAVKDELHRSTLQWCFIILLIFTSYYNQVILMKELQKMSEIITILEAVIEEQPP